MKPDPLAKFRTKQHNFKLPFKPRIDAGLNRKLWRCEGCDSEVIFPKEITQSEVNRKMSLRLPCLNAEMMKDF